jgi:predicted transcriptional regulator
MTAKAQILETVQNMPEEAHMHEIVDQIKLVAGIRKAREDVKAGRVVPIEEVEEELPKWISKS